MVVWNLIKYCCTFNYVGLLVKTDSSLRHALRVPLEHQLTPYRT
ncbi:hypothetical protein SUNDANCE_3 [Brevibacillus phage Sundance]|nr:hypothetical protein AVT09_gp003 [Brevibacillus phage Sundance]ALA47819.1 hypothetical protein SUNDANCE_3 [Brevibacillus phage Sundance]